MLLRVAAPPCPVRRARETAGSGALVKAICILVLGAGGVFAMVAATRAQQLSNEKDILELRLGQRIKVDDGTCPAGQVKEISGTKMTAGGVVRTQKCIPRTGPKRK
jgi:hypothetical protein